MGLSFRRSMSSAGCPLTPRMSSAGITLSSVLLADIARESFLLETIHFCGDRPVEKPSAVAVIILGKMLSLVTGGKLYSVLLQKYS